MLAALVNGLLLVAVSVAIAIAAIGRFSDPPEIEGGGVLALGVLGLAGNLAATCVLARGERDDVNLEGVLRHSVADALGSLGVVVAGAVVLLGGSDDRRPDRRPADRGPRPRLLLAADQGAVRRADGGGAGRPRRRRRSGAAICGEEGVRSVHDLHVWTVTAGFGASPPTSSSPAAADRDLVRQRLELLLRERYGIEHTTLQMEEEADQAACCGSRTPRPGAYSAVSQARLQV